MSNMVSSNSSTFFGVRMRKEKEQQSITQPGVSSLIDPLFAVSRRRQALMTPMALSTCGAEGCGKAEPV
jgi:hypothetical protein